MEMPARADRGVRPYGMESKGEDAVEVVGACTGGRRRHDKGRTEASCHTG